MFKSLKVHDNVSGFFKSTVSCEVLEYKVKIEREKIRFFLATTELVDKYKEYDV